MRNKIIEEAEEYIQAFYEKRKLNVETNKTNNREKEKVNVELLLSTTLSFTRLLVYLLLQNGFCIWSSYTWLIKKSFTRVLTSNIGKQ